MQNFFVDEGNLGNNPVLKYFPVKGKDGHTEQRAVIEMQVRFDFRELDKKANEFIDTAGFWAQVSLWGKRAEYLHKHLGKGCRVVVIGEIKQHEFIRQSGERKGQEGNAIHIEASTVALILVGIEQVIFESKIAQSTELAHDAHDQISFTPAD